MAELPDVEVIRKYVRENFIGEEISDVEVKNKKILVDLSPVIFVKFVRDKVIGDVKRHGNILFLGVDGRFIFFSFGAGGFMSYLRMDEFVEYERVSFSLNGYRLAFGSRGISEKVGFVDSVEEYVEERSLGKDAFEISFDDLSALLKEKSSYIKSFLVNQSIIAGLGDIYSDEILFQAGIHPKRNTKYLTKGDHKKIYSALRRVLKVSIDKGAVLENMPSNYLLKRREGEKCPKCNGNVNKIYIGSRVSYYCPECQKG